MPGLGPLGGLAGALRFAADHDYAGVLTVSCDTVRMPDGLLPALLRRSPSYCADAPVIGHWPVDLLDRLLAHLSGLVPGEGKRPGLSVRGWAEAVGALPIAAGGPVGNVNTRADLAREAEPATA
jgi:molybdenum cofactor guanylyltransferase